MRCSGGGNADLGQQVDGALARRASSDRFEMGPDRLDELVADPVERIEAGQRILEDHADALAADAAQSPPAADCRCACPTDRSRRRRCGRADRSGRSRPRPVTDLPAPDSPTTPSTSPLRDVERDAVDRVQRAAAGDELDRRGCGRRGRRYRVIWQLRIQRVAQPVAEQVDRQRPARPARGRGRPRSTIRRRTDNCCRSGSACRARAGVGGMPTPRNDSVASVMTASARLMVAITRTGPDRRSAARGAA